MGFTTGLVRLLHTHNTTSTSQLTHLLQLGGLTLTTGTLYLTLSAHRRNRLTQALQIRQNVLVLNHLSSGSSSLLRQSPSLASHLAPIDPSTPSDTLTPTSTLSESSYSPSGELEADPESMYGSRRRRMARLEGRDRAQNGVDGGIGQEVRERWNQGVEKVAMKVQHTDWGVVREMVEEGMGYVYGLVRRETSK